MSDAFNVQDEIAKATTSAVATTIVDAEQRRATWKLPADLDAWEAYQRGMWHMSKCDAAENRSARAFFQRTIELDPAYPAGYGALAWSIMMSASIFSEMTIAEGCALSEPLVSKAIALDQDDTEVRARLALAALLKGDLEGAVAEAEQVLSVDERCAGALGVKGAALVYSGNREEGRRALRQYLKLSPRDPARPIRLSQIATSMYLDGDYQWGGEHCAAGGPAIPEPSDRLSLARGLAGPARPCRRGEGRVANPADDLAVFVRDVRAAAAEILQHRICSHAGGAAQGRMARIRALAGKTFLGGVSAPGSISGPRRAGTRMSEGRPAYGHPFLFLMS